MKVISERKESIIEILRIRDGGEEHKKLHFQLVERRNSETLYPIIESGVEKGSTIYSDMWHAYNNLESEGYDHKCVNHSVEFKSEDGCCTNTIEGLWGLVKLKIKKMKGVLRSRLVYVLDELMYRYRFGHENGDVFVGLYLTYPNSNTSLRKLNKYVILSIHIFLLFLLYVLVCSIIYFMFRNSGLFAEFRSAMHKNIK